MGMGIKLKYVFFFVSLALLAGCGAEHYEYPLYQPRSQVYGKMLPLRVAIPYPEEGLSAPDRDEDLEGVIKSSCHETPTYISQRLEISRGLLDVQLALRGELKQLGEDVSRMLAQNLDMLATVGRAAGVRPPRVMEVIAGARGEAARSVAEPDGVRKPVDGISKRLLPGDLRKLAAESGVNEELAGRLRSALQGDSAAPGAVQEGLAGCGKDTDCKGDRICVKGECISPAGGRGR